MNSGRHVILKGSFQPTENGALRVGDIDPDSQIEITVYLRAPSLPDPDAMLAEPLSREQFESKYGARRADAVKVARVLKAYGLNIEETSLAERCLRVSGSAAAMEAAFEPHLGVYQSAGQYEFLGREGELKIPAELDGIIKGVFGFDQRRISRPLHSRQPSPILNSHCLLKNSKQG